MRNVLLSWGSLDPSITNSVPGWQLQHRNTRKQHHCAATTCRQSFLRTASNIACLEHRHLAPSWSLHLLARCVLRHAPPPPGDANATQLTDVTKAIKSILGDGNVETELAPSYQKYNEEQFTTTKLPGGSTEILVSPYNSLGDGRYYDVETQSSFDFDHATQKASAVQSYVVESQHEDLM